jgi:hypothetical protein
MRYLERPVAPPLRDPPGPSTGADDLGQLDEQQRHPPPARRPAARVPARQTGRKTPLPALINVSIPAGTLLGWSDAPADVGSWGLMDAETARALIEAASRHPRTRWRTYTTHPTQYEE